MRSLSRACLSVWQAEPRRPSLPASRLFLPHPSPSINWGETTPAGVGAKKNGSAVTILIPDLKVKEAPEGRPRLVARSWLQGLLVLVL